MAAPGDVVNDSRGQLLASLQPEDVHALSESVIESLADRLTRHMAQPMPSSEPTARWTSTELSRTSA